MRFNKKSSPKSEKKAPPKAHKKGVVGYNKKTALLEEAITYMNGGKYGRSSAALKELLALDPLNTEARRLFATLHLRLGSLISARTAFESLAREALERQDFWLAESLLREYLTAGPRCVPFLEMLGQVYEQKGDSMAAVAEYGKAIDVLIEDPDSDHPGRAADLFAKIRSLAGDSPEAFRLAALFDSATGQLLSPPAASNPISSVEDQQPAIESASLTGESSATLVEPPPTSADQITGPDTPAEPEASACLADQPDQNAPTIAHDVALPDSTENQEPTVQEDSADERQVTAVRAQDDVSPAPQISDDVPPVAPISETLDTSDPPLRLADDEAAISVQALTPTPTPPPFPALDTTGVSFEKEAVPQAVESPIAGPDLSLHEVTQPIAEAPSAPLPMPWDQVQDTTLSIPLPSIEPETAQVSDTQPTDHAEDASVPEPVATADDQATLPVQPESLLSSMSWEEILAAVGKGPDVPPEAKPVMSSTAPHEPIDQALSVSEPSSFDSENPILTPISEPVAEAQALSVPMPWEQVEEESVPILDHEPEPEFGVVPETPFSPVIDDTALPQAEERTGETNDATLAIGDAIPTPSTEPEQGPLPSSPLTLQEPVVEQSTTPSVEPPLDHSALATPVIEETQVASPVPSEPQAIDPSPIQFTADETSFPDETSLPAIAEEAAASGADPLSEAQRDEPLTIRADQETASQEPRFVESEAAAEVAGVSEPSSDAATHPDRADQEDPIPVVQEPLGIGPSPTDQAVLLEEQAVPPSPIIEPESPAAAPEQAASGEIKILWDEPSAQSLPEQAGSGLLSRWLRRSKPEEPAHLEPSEGSSPEMPPVQLEHTEHLAAAPPTPIIPAGDVAREQAAPSLAALPAGTGEKTGRVKIRSQRAGSLSGHVGSGLVRLIGTCFSTTRSIIVSLLALISAVLASGLAAVGLAVLTWVLMEERPNTAFYNLTATPQRTLQEASANGYLALLGFDRGTNQDAAQAGFARRFEKSDLTMIGTCLAGSPEHLGGGRTDTEDRLADWFRDPDPAARFRGQAANLRAWVGQHDRSMIRYKQWLTMPFEDWGYGEPMSPNCPMILHAHRLYVAEGFAQDADSGIERLVADLTKWRHVMGHAKSLPIKMLAVGAMNDDAAIVSGLLARPDLDDKLLGPLSKAASPLDQVEQSLRWPMQSELKAAGKIQDAILKPDAGEPLPLYVQLIAMMPLPAQKRLNVYADYYEASGKASAEGRFAGLPKRAGFVRYPAESWLDYGLNPIENILGVPPLPEWQTYGGRVLELDARLRLAGLQAWIRRSPKEQDIPTRMAKAGQALYDPFTGFPMLVNARRGLIYSVGQDGKDHDGRPGLDIAAVIPLMAGELPQDGKRSASTSKTRP